MSVMSETMILLLRLNVLVFIYPGSLTSVMCIEAYSKLMTVKIQSCLMSLFSRVLVSFVYSEIAN